MCQIACVFDDERALPPTMLIFAPRAPDLRSFPPRVAWSAHAEIGGRHCLSPSVNEDIPGRSDGGHRRLDGLNRVGEGATCAYGPKMGFYSVSRTRLTEIASNAANHLRTHSELLQRKCESGSDDGGANQNG